MCIRDSFVAAGFLVPLLAWGTYATLAFGGPLPTSFGVKIAEAHRLEEGTADRDVHASAPEFLGNVAKMSLGLSGRFNLPQVDSPRFGRVRPLAERVAGWIRVAIAVGALVLSLIHI